MPRIMLKGGVWRNTEDEVLKVAVAKYGLNQWSRVASLLHRKSAKQCKARWNEWLDPSIKKVEWSREEEEKLLHLAKVFPTQWKTISSNIGRTAAQCLERYEFLLDQALKKEQGGTTIESESALRRLMPGEIDPNPETKPARPDPQDMDQDELEMLSEARARCANTQGKKAKRKAREKQLQEARRLAALQKKRELRMAGIFTGQGRKRKHGIDYNAEIPFHKTVVQGEHDLTADEVVNKRFDFKKLRQEHIDGKMRSEVEAEERKKDKLKPKPPPPMFQFQPKRSELILDGPQNEPGSRNGKSKLSAGVELPELLNLPSPKNDVDLDFENEDLDSCDDGDAIEPDQAELDEIARKREEEEKAAAFKRLSEAIQKELSRPNDIPNNPQDLNNYTFGQLKEVMQLVNKEMLTLLHFDAHNNKTEDQQRFESKKWQKGTDISKYRNEYLAKYPKEDFSDEQLIEAKELVAQEMKSLGYLRMESYQDFFERTFTPIGSMRDDVAETYTEFNSKANELSERISMIKDKLKDQHETFHTQFNRLSESINEQADRVQEAQIELTTFERLSEVESRAAKGRVEALRNDVACLKAQQNRLQEQYDFVVRNLEKQCLNESIQC